MKTQITAPCPTACEAIKKNKKRGTANPCQWKKNAIATKLREIMYPIDPIYIKTFRPNLSIKKTPIKVKTRLTAPIPILLNRAVLSPKPAS